MSHSPISTQNCSILTAVLLCFTLKCVFYFHQQTFELQRSVMVFKLFGSVFKNTMHISHDENEVKCSQISKAENQELKLCCLMRNLCRGCALEKIHVFFVVNVFSIHICYTFILNPHVNISDLISLHVFRNQIFSNKETYEHFGNFTAIFSRTVINFYLFICFDN